MGKLEVTSAGVPENGDSRLQKQILINKFYKEFFRYDNFNNFFF